MKCAAPDPAPDVVEPHATAERVSWVAFCAILFGIPLATSNLTALGIGSTSLLWHDPESSKVVVLGLLASVSLAAWSVSLSAGRPIRWTGVHWIGVAALGWLGLSSDFAFDRAAALVGSSMRYEGLVVYTVYFIVFFLGTQLATSERRRRLAAWAVVAGGGLGAVLGVLQHFGLDPTTWPPASWEPARAFGTMGNPVPYAGSLLFPLAISFALALAEKKATLKVVAWALFALISAACLFSFARGAWIAGAAAVVVLVVAAARMRVRPGRIDLAMGAAALVALLGAGATTLARPDQVTNALARLLSIFEVSAGSQATRFLIWRTALAAIGEDPLTGTGLGGFSLAFTRLRPIEFIQAAGAMELVEHAHSAPLDVAATAGVPAALLVSVFIGWSLVIGTRALVQQNGHTHRLIALGVWVAVGAHALFVLAQVTSVGSSAVLFGLLGCVVAPACAFPRHPIGAKRLLALRGLAAVLALCVTTFAGSVLYGNALAQRSLLEPNPSRRVELAAASTRVAPLLGTSDLRLGLAQAELMYSRIVTAVSLQEQGADPSAAISEALEAYHSAADTLYSYASRRRYDIEAWDPLIGLHLQYAEAFTDEEGLTRAERTAREALDLIPGEPILLVRLGTAQLLAGSAEAALQAADAALARDPSFAEARALRERALEALGLPAPK